MVKWSEYNEMLGYIKGADDDVRPRGELLQKLGFVVPHGNVELKPLDFFKGNCVIGGKELDRPTKLGLQVELLELLYQGVLKRISTSEYKNLGDLYIVRLDFSDGCVCELVEKLEVVVKDLATNVVGLLFKFHDDSLGCRKFYIVDYGDLPSWDCGLIDTYLNSKYFLRDFIKIEVLGFEFACLSY